MSKRKKLSEADRKKILASADAVAMEDVRRIADRVVEEARRAAVRRSVLINPGSSRPSSTRH